MVKDRKTLFIILFISIFSVGVISIAFAALSQTLNITSGKVTQNALTWNVGFVEGTYTGTPDGTSNNGLSCGSITATRNSLTVANATLSKPGDKCEYEIPISNTGSLDAYLQNVSYTAPTSTSCTINNPGDNSLVYGDMTCGNLNYYIYVDFCDSIVHVAPNSTRPLYLYIAYVGNSLNGSSVSQRNGKMTFTYSDDSNNALNEWGEC